VHTAVKIAPNYPGPVVHVLDASRAVGVAGSLLSDELKAGFVSELRDEYEQVRRDRAARQREVKRQPIAAARRNKKTLDWSCVAPAPSFEGVRVFDDFPLAELVPRIDWTPFFQTWELAGSYPAILEDPKVGEAARDLFRDAQAMLERIVDEHWLRARAVVGFFPANSDGAEEIRLKTPGGEVKVQSIRQQMVKNDGRPNLALADFIAPASSGVQDHLGAFVVTTGLGLDEKVAEFEATNDDYSSIRVKALADRLAEAFAERLHERVRRELWGYAPDEHLDNQAIIREQYQGIRPAPGYPACPDHTEKRTLFALLDAASLRRRWRPRLRAMGRGRDPGRQRSRAVQPGDPPLRRRSAAPSQSRAGPGCVVHRGRCALVHHPVRARFDPCRAPDARLPATDRGRDARDPGRVPGHRGGSGSGRGARQDPARAAHR
jgi:5-methyltetrahydrofolate--homocysteine methyltransferase